MGKRKMIFLLILLLIFCSFLVLFLGRYSLAPNEVFKMIVDRSFEGNTKSSRVVLMNIRIPRVLTAVLVGASLALSGASYQSTFMNPMVSPNLLGVTSGAGFGASLAILLGLNNTLVQLFSFIFGLGTVAVTYFISNQLNKRFNASIVTMILSGMVIGSLFNALISLMKFLADPNDTLPEITFWLMGSLSGITMKELVIIAVPIIIGSFILVMYRWQMNLLALGDDEANAIGLNTNRVRLIIVLCSTLIVSASVSLCGIIGWIGVVIPHIARYIVGSDNRYLVPTSIVIGGIYLLIIDTIARTMLPVELPLSILTAVIGAPFFLYLMFKRKEAWN